MLYVGGGWAFLGCLPSSCHGLVTKLGEKLIAIWCTRGFAGLRCLIMVDIREILQRLHGGESLDEAAAHRFFSAMLEGQIEVGQVAAAMAHCPAPPARLLVTGGGRLNATLMGMIGAAVDCPVAPVEAAGLDGDMLEAQAFAFLAVRVARGWPTSCPATTGVPVAVGGGILSAPGSAG